MQIALSCGGVWCAAQPELRESVATSEAPLIAGGQQLGILSIAGMTAEAQASQPFVTQLATLIALALDALATRQSLTDEQWVRTQVLSTISHDFRTPLTTIRGATQLLVRRPAQVLQREISPWIAGSR